MLRLLLIVLCVLCASVPASTAEIKFTVGSSDFPPIISIEGQILPGDDEKFDRFALQLDNADIFLSSPGGDARVGLAIAKTVALRRYNTFVPANTLCASMCAVIWVSGKERFASTASLIGFHSAYRLSDGSESGEVNGQISIHLFQLNLLPSAIAWMQRAGPNDMAWLSPSVANELGLFVRYVVPKATQVGPQQSTIKQDTSSAAAFSKLENRDIFGFDLGSAIKSPQAADCATMCSSKSNCQAFTFNKSNSLCYLKSGGKEVLWNKNTESGHISSLSKELKFLKIVISNSTRLEGKALRELLGATLANCAETCDSDMQCSGFEYEKPPSGSCRLKTGELRKHKKPRLTAGVKTAE